MDDLKRMAVFASVVQHGSMTGAGRVLGMSPSAVSQQVRQLEREGGVTLLHRSTRKLALTEAGQRYHAQCAAMCAAAEQARAELAAGENAIYFSPTQDFDFSDADGSFFGFVKVVPDIGAVDADAIKQAVADYQTVIWPAELYASSAPSCH